MRKLCRFQCSFQKAAKLRGDLSAGKDQVSSPKPRKGSGQAITRMRKKRLMVPPGGGEGVKGPVP